MASLNPRHSAICRLLGVAQHGVAAADQHRHIGRRDVESVQQRLGVGIAIEVDVGERMVVAGQELLHPQRAGAMRRPDQDDITQAIRNQLGPPQDECAHDDVAQLGIGLNERQQLLVVDLEDLARLAHERLCQRASPGDHVRFHRETLPADA